VESITYLGLVMEALGNYARALELYSDGLKTGREIGDQWLAALCLTHHTALSGITEDLVDPEIKYERMQSVVADWRRHW